MSLGAHAVCRNRLDRNIGCYAVFETSRIEVSPTLPIIVGTRPLASFARSETISASAIGFSLPR